MKLTIAILSTTALLLAGCAIRPPATVPAAHDAETPALDRVVHQLGALETSGVGIRHSIDRVTVTLPGTMVFASSSSKIDEKAHDALDDIVATLNQVLETQVHIVAHTDASGGTRSNQALSKARAEAVAVYLAEHGVVSTRLSIFGAGETAPVATNATPAGRATNRRVELEVTADE